MQYVVLLYELSAAFSTVNHDFLLSKLFAEFVFCDVALEWFPKYLNNKLLSKLLAVLLIQLMLSLVYPRVQF